MILVRAFDSVPVCYETMAGSGDIPFREKQPTIRKMIALAFLACTLFLPATTEARPLRMANYSTAVELEIWRMGYCIEGSWCQFARNWPILLHVESSWPTSESMRRDDNRCELEIQAVWFTWRENICIKYMRFKIPTDIHEHYSTALYNVLQDGDVILLGERSHYFKAGEKAEEEESASIAVDSCGKKVVAQFVTCKGGRWSPRPKFYGVFSPQMTSPPILYELMSTGEANTPLAGAETSNDEFIPPTIELQFRRTGYCTEESCSQVASILPISLETGQGLPTSGTDIREDQCEPAAQTVWFSWECSACMNTMTFEIPINAHGYGKNYSITLYNVLKDGSVTFLGEHSSHFKAGERPKILKGSVNIAVHSCGKKVVGQFTTCKGGRWNPSPKFYGTLESIGELSTKMQTPAQVLDELAPTEQAKDSAQSESVETSTDHTDVTVAMPNYPVNIFVFVLGILASLIMLCYGCSLDGFKRFRPPPIFKHSTDANQGLDGLMGSRCLARQKTQGESVCQLLSTNS